VVGVRGDAPPVESYEDVDSRSRRGGRFRLQGLCEIRRECGGEEVCDFLLVPGRGHAIGEFGTLDDEYIILLPQTKGHAALNQFFLPRLSQPIRVATTQTQNLDMIPQRRLRQRQDRRGEKHSLVVRVRDEQTDALVAQLGESAARHADGVQPARDRHEGQREDREPLHGSLLRL